MRFGSVLPLFLPMIMVRSFFISPNIQIGIVRNFSKKAVQMRAKKTSDTGIDTKGMSPLYKPRSDNQQQYVNHLMDSRIPIVLGIGPAGSGKTLFACNTAVTALKKGYIKKIILTRPVVPVEEDIGFLPGSLIHKMDPWTRPIFDILLEFYSQKDIDSMLHGGVLEISPLAFMRGRTFKNAFIIADEMQNSSPNQMLMLTTRIGEGSKLVITGDLQQSDRSKDNGLVDLINKLKKYDQYCMASGGASPDIRMVKMEAIDIQRSPIVSKLLEIYDEPVYIPPKMEDGNIRVFDSDIVSRSERGDAALLPSYLINKDPSRFPWEPKSI